MSGQVQSSSSFALEDKVDQLFSLEEQMVDLRN